MKHQRRTFSCYWDNTLYDKLNIFVLVKVPLFLASVICWSCCLFCKFSFWFCFCPKFFLFIVLLSSWFLRFFLFWGSSFYKFGRHHVPAVCLWSSSKKSSFIGSSVGLFLSAVALVSNDANVDNNCSFVILSLSAKGLMFL